MTQESSFAQVTREGIERTINEAVNAGDMNLADAQLDIYPTGFSRPEISLEQAHEIAKHSQPLRKVVAFNPYRKAA